MSTLDSKLIDDLRSRLRGPLFLQGDATYDEARSIWNAMIDRRPAIVARCLGVVDVVTAVNFARENKLLLSIKGGGHNIAGLAVCEGGLMLDMSSMRGVWVNPSERIARAQAGCLLGDVDRETQIHNLATVLGFVSNTGIAGLTLGGGFGYLSRRFGFACDNLLAAEMVTAEGHIVRASEKENQDLLWGLRGGGGNFGVVTGFEYRLHPVGADIIGGLIAWRAEDARDVLRMYHSLIQQAAPELSCAVILRKAPPAPWLSTDVHGKLIVALAVCHSGSIEVAQRQVSTIKSFGKPVGDIVQRRPYVSQQSIIDATQPKGRRYYWKSDYLPGLSPELLERAVAHAEQIASVHSGIILFPMGPAPGHLDESYSAVGNRDATFVVNIAAAWEKAEDDAVNVEWARSAWRDMHRFSTGRANVNFLSEEEGADRIQATYGKNYGRLLEIKQKWDPQNLFKANKNIAPRT